MATKTRRNGEPIHAKGEGLEFESSVGSANRLARFTAAQACEVVRLKASGLSNEQIAKQFKTTAKTVNAIVLGRSYFDETLEVRKQYRSRLQPS